MTPPRKSATERLRGKRVCSWFENMTTNFQRNISRNFWNTSRYPSGSFTMLSTNSARLISGARRTASGHCGTQCGKHEGDDWRPMKSVRLIARLDIKGPNVIKGVHLEGLRVIGDPQEYARRYYEQGADELLYVDVVASLYGRSKLTEIVR